MFAFERLAEEKIREAIAAGELEHCWAHCRRRLGKLLALSREATLNTAEPRQKDRRFFAFRFWKSWEQNTASGRGKRVAAGITEPDRQVSNAQQLQRAYLDERLWLRRRINELAGHADEIARRAHEALVEKEIRDQCPVVFLLGSPGVSAKNILAQFDREFPDLPLDGNAARGHALRE